MITPLHTVKLISMSSSYLPSTGKVNMMLVRPKWGVYYSPHQERPFCGIASFCLDATFFLITGQPQGEISIKKLEIIGHIYQLGLMAPYMPPLEHYLNTTDITFL